MNHEIFLRSLKRHTDGKLFGRDTEVKELQDIYHRVQTQCVPQAVFVHGYSGSGKSQLIHHALARDRGDHGGGGLFVSGKYDQLASRRGCRSYSAITDACRSLCLALQNDQRDSIRNAKQLTIQLLEKALVKDAPILSNLLPELITLVPALFVEDTSSNGGNSMAGHFQFDRLKGALKLFLACVSKFIPVCIFIDDLQWACPASVEIIESLLSMYTTTTSSTSAAAEGKEASVASLATDLRGEGSSRGDFDLGNYSTALATEEETTAAASTSSEVEIGMLLFVGAYRDNELVLGEHPLAEPIQQLELLDCSTKLHVSDLTLPSLNLFIATLLGYEEDTSSLRTTLPLSQSIHQRTHGNIFFVLQFLEMLVSTNILQYSFVTMKWEWDTNRVFEQTTASENVTDLLISRMQKRLPPTTALALIVASHLGNRFEANILKLVLDKWQTTTAPAAANHDDFTMRESMTSSSSLRSLNLRESWTVVGASTRASIPAGLVLVAEEAEEDDHDHPEDTTINNSLTQGGKQDAGGDTTNSRNHEVTQQQIEKQLSKSKDGEEGVKSSNDQFDFLQLLIEEGFVVPIDNVTGGIWYRFLHDRIQQAAAEGLIDSPQEKKALRYRLGTLLLDINKTTPQKTWAALSAVDLLNTTKDLILEKPHRTIELAKANIQAAKIAASQSAFGTAAEYLGHCRSLFTPATTATSNNGLKLWDDHYDLAIQMYTMSAEMSFCCGHLRECLEMFQQVKIRRRQPKDSWLASYIAMKALGEEAQYEESIDIAYEVLKETGFRIPPGGVTPPDVGTAYEKAKSELTKRTDQEILGLPDEPMTEDGTSGDLIWKICSTAMLIVWHANRLLDHAYLACNMTIRTMEQGLSQYSGQTFAVQAITCIVNNDFDLVKRLSKLWNHPSIAMRYVGKEIEAGTRAAGNAVVAHLFQPLTLVAEGFMKGYESGMKTGSLEWAMTDAGCYLLTLFMSGLPLSQFERDSWTLIKEMKRYGNRIHRPMCELYLQCALQLMGKANNNNKSGGLDDDDDDDDVCSGTGLLEGEPTKEYNIPQIIAGTIRPDEFPVHVAWFAQLMISYYLDDFDTAAEMAVKHEDFGPVDWPMVWSIAQSYYRGLAYVAKIRLLQNKTGTRKKRSRGVPVLLLSRSCGCGWFSKRREVQFYFQRAKNQLSQLKGCVEHGLINMHHMYKILQAEIESITPGSTHEEVTQLYKDAIRSAKRSGFQQDAALASERIAVYYMAMAPSSSNRASAAFKAIHNNSNNNNNNALYAASLHLESSVEDYENWGAHRKADLLRSKYQDLSLTAAPGCEDDNLVRDDASDCSGSHCSRRFGTISEPVARDSRVKFTRSIMS